MMRWSIFPFLICLLYQTSPTHPPSKDSLCGLVVDSVRKATCLNCFITAGELGDNPDGYRLCCGTQLPPLLAECTVPHPDRRLGRIQIDKPVVHPNHTNANLLPNCLKRKMRVLSRYLLRENTFAKQAGTIVKLVVLSKLIKRGGDNMLNIWAERLILCRNGTKQFFENHASSSLNDYEFSCYNRRSYKEHNSFENEEGEEDNQDYGRDLGMLKSPHFTLEDDGDDEVYDEGELRTPSTGGGNGLPYGGTNSISDELRMGVSIIEELNRSNATLQLISYMTEDEFFAPVPNHWLQGLFTYYKDFRESLNQNTG